MKTTRLIGLFSAMALAPNLAGAQDATDDHPTYAKEVSRIIQKNCQICHQPGQIGPMSFTNYEEVHPAPPSIE